MRVTNLLLIRNKNMLKIWLIKYYKKIFLMQRIRRFLFRGSLNDALLKKTFSLQKSQVLGAWYDFIHFHDNYKWHYNETYNNSRASNNQQVKLCRHRLKVMFYCRLLLSSYLLVFLIWLSYSWRTELKFERIGGIRIQELFQLRH